LIYPHLPQRSGRSIVANTNNPPQDPPATTLPPSIDEKPIAPTPDIIIPKISILEKKISILEQKIVALEQKKIVIPDISILEKKIVALENSKQESKIVKEIPKKSLFRKFLTKFFGRRW